MPKNRFSEFLQYHAAMQDAGDIDPGYPMLRYVADRWELNVEQRYWAAFLYATCYCAPTAYYIINRFPDEAYTDHDAVERWWAAEGRANCIFQTDRGWVRSRNQFTDMLRSYRKWLGGMTQEQKFMSLRTPDPQQTYRNVYQEASSLYQMGRFALFLYLEAVHVVTGYPMKPDTLDLRNAESSRNGICYAIGQDDWITGKETGRTTIPDKAYKVLNNGLHHLITLLERERPGERADIWNVETSLCAFKKYKRGQRYVGYYLDRQLGEIDKISKLVKTGVDWSLLRDFRVETFDKVWLKELK